MEHKVEEVKLKCGAKGLLIDVPEAPVFVMEVMFRAGYNSVKNPEIREVAHIMEHMACGANAMHPSSAEVDRYIQKNGAYSNAYTGRDYLSYVRVCPDFDWERILKQLIIQVTTPKFLEKEFKAEFGNVQEEMQLSSNDKWTELALVMNGRFGLAFSETYPERLKKMQGVKWGDIREHYERTHGADNAVFFIAGNMRGKKNEILRMLEGLKDLPKTKKFNLYKYPSIKSFKEPVVLPKSDVPNIYLSMELNSKWMEEDKTKLTKTMVANLGVLNKILSSGDHSRIYGKARQRGLVYSLGCGRGFDEQGHYSWELYCQVGRENIDKLLQLIVDEVKLLIKKGLSKEEVEGAITALKGSTRMDNQTAKRILDWNSGWYTSHEEEKVYNFDEVDGWYDGVTPESIQELFLNLIKTKKWGAGFLGNVTEADAKKWNNKLKEIFNE